MGAVYFPLDRSTVISKIYITSEALCLKHSIQNFKASQRPATNEQWGENYFLGEKPEETKCVQPGTKGCGGNW